MSRPRDPAPQLQSAAMEFIPVTCPWCFERTEVAVEPDLQGRFVVDCEVCCRPWEVVVQWTPDGPVAQVERGN